ncbi:peroxisomal ATPase PEX6 isoform X2 [Battus philenor]|uniref:peroxisomal ATPase PEX6 isoform X2 n=1 Tax=Battus philenor TaxID=42288 RepID=UPI0035CEADCC
MKEQTSFQLWVTKFCIKVIYPKLNPYIFLVYLAVKSNNLLSKSAAVSKKMSNLTLKTIPSYITKYIVKEESSESILNVSLHKCIIISQANFLELSVENIFYRDNKILWVALKLIPEERKKYEEKRIKEISNSSPFKYGFNLQTSEIHKNLWTGNITDNFAYSRIVPVIPSPYLHDGTALVSENEFYNILSSIGIDNIVNISEVGISFHPVPTFDCAPKIASVAEVCVIVNDFDLSNDFIKEVLNNYFEEPRLVSENDLITVYLNASIMAKYHYKYLDLVESIGMLHFKCKMISSDVDIDISTTSAKTALSNTVRAFYIVKGVTQLTLGENIHSMKPAHKYLKLQKLHSQHLNLVHICPTGLQEKFDQIQEAITPFLTKEINDLSSSLSSPIIPMFLVTGSMGSGRHLLVKTLAKYNGLNCLQADCNSLQSSTAKQTESKINLTIQKAKAAAPTIILLDNFEVFAVDSENNEDQRIIEYFINSITDLYQHYTKHSLIFIAITEKVDLKPNIMRIFLDKFHLPKLSSQQRYEMLQWFVSAMQLNLHEKDKHPKNEYTINTEDISGSSSLSKISKDILHRIASKTETFVYGDIDTLVHFAMRESYLKQQGSYTNLAQDPNLQFIREEDFNIALEQIRSLQSHHLDAPKIPKVYWDDIGGLDKLKKELLKTIEFPIKFPHLFKNSSLKRSGLLLYGPPGCGKTLVAKAVSTELNVSFLSVKGPELLNMYIGQSEENVRKVFESARASSPCIVFLDELDALAPRRGAAGDSGGASDRVVSQLLAEVDGVSDGEEKSSFVFIMGATNRPDLLEQSLLRPGRLDKLIYVGPYTGTMEKTSVLNALCRSYKLRPEVNLTDVAEALPERCTGADLMQVVSSARSAAVRALVDKINNGLVKETDLSPDSVILGVSELWQGVESFRPSVTEEELAYYESLQHQM